MDKTMALVYLRELFGQQAEPKVYVRVNTVARSGMSRCMTFYAVRGDEVACITYHVAAALRKAFTREGVRYNGCGMDMVAHAVEELSGVLFGRTDFIQPRRLD